MNQPQQEKREGLDRMTLLMASIPLAILLMLTLVFRFTTADVAIASLFYDEATQTWPMFGHPISRLAFHVMPLPGLALGFFGGLVAASGYLSRKTRIPRSAGVYLLLVMVIGPGLLVNTAFKGLWSRPRPMQIEQFDGREAFAPVWTNSFPSTSRSFPSGHASMGFLFIAPGFLLIRRRPVVAILFFTLGIGMGGLAGTIRMAEGGHFASDILWSAGIVYMCCLIVLLALRGSQARHKQSAKSRLRSELLQTVNGRWQRMLDAAPGDQSAEPKPADRGSDRRAA